MYEEPAGENIETEKEEEEEEEVEEEVGVIYPQWEALPVQEIEDLLGRENPQEVQEDLQNVLNYRNHQFDLRESILLDYYVRGLWWAKEANLSGTQTSFIMAVLHRMLDNMLEKQMSLVDNLTEFAKALSPACHEDTSKEEGPPALLDQDQATALIQYITDSFLHKHGLYQLVCRKSRQDELTSLERTVEVFSYDDPLTPLEEGIPVRYLLPMEKRVPVVEKDEEAEEGEETLPDGT